MEISQVVSLSSNSSEVTLPPEVYDSLERSHLDSLTASENGVAYGRTTGVGANRNVIADDADGSHGMRLIQSHAAGSGRAYPIDVARAGMVVRAHQLSQPGSGIRPAVVVALVDALRAGRVSPFREFGGIGTGDITVLGELAACLTGLQPWSDGIVQRFAEPFDASDALSFMSSSAPTLGLAAHSLERLATVIKASWTVAALSSVPIRANRQQWSEVAQSTRPSPGVTECMTVIRRLLDGTDYETARTQDPLAYRVMPFIFGPLLETFGHAVDETNATINSRIENPRFTAGGVWHHGAFNLTSVALAFDTLRLAMCQWASSSVARIVKLNDPAYTDQGRFLATGPAGSSGVMVLEYCAASALEKVRTLAEPSSRNTTSISIGTEDHAPFASRSVAATFDVFEAFETVVACELLTTVRAIRGCRTATLGGPMNDLLEACSALPRDTEDRVLVNDVDRARSVLPALADLYSLGQ